MQLTFTPSGGQAADCTNQTNEDFVESWTFTAPTVAAEGWADVAKAGLTSTTPTSAFTATAGSRFKLTTTTGTSGLTAVTYGAGKEGAGVTWGTVAVCDTKKWADANACNGIDLPWGRNSWAHPDGKGTTAAKGRFFRWLADAVTDKTAQFSVEKDDVIYVVLYEKWGQAPVNNDGTNSITAYSTTTKFGYEAASKRSGAYAC